MTDKEYNCPKCHIPMVLASTDYYYKCKPCCIKYYVKLGDNVYPVLKTLDNTFWVNDDLLFEGTFEECCKFFKLKAFL